ncbi:hypothetical protein ACN9MU_20160 [Pseudoduganella sp. R-32]|uniref:hypothetical protein n=1 Tax=Pseudoduganella sp. R-32 TaxID=3404061 RepID=UPI003CFAD9DA
MTMQRLDLPNSRIRSEGGAIVGTSFELREPTYVFFLALSYVHYVRGTIGQSLQLISLDESGSTYQPIAYSSICARGQKEVSDSRVSALLYLGPGRYAWRAEVNEGEALGKVDQRGYVEYAIANTPIHMYCKGDGELYTTVSGDDAVKTAVAAQRINFGPNSPGTIVLRLDVTNRRTGSVLPTPEVTRASIGEPSVVTGALQFTADRGDRLLLQAVCHATQATVGRDNNGLRTLDVSA